MGGNNFSESEISRLADANLMCINAAVRGYIYDFDNLTLGRGKNGFMYRKPDDGRWMLVQWDSDGQAFRTQDVAGRLVGGLNGVANYFDKDYIKRIFDYYLTEIRDNYDHDSIRMNTWLDLESAVSASYNSNESLINGFLALREPHVLTAQRGIGASYGVPLSLSTASTTTTNALFSIAGTAGSAMLGIRIEGHPEATLQWQNKTDWVVSNIRLDPGVNTLMISGVDFRGDVVEQTSLSVTKTGNAAPVVDLDVSPASWNVQITDALEVDAGDSFDPEGTALGFAFTVIGPGSGVVTLNNNGDRATIDFDLPGVYEITLVVSDMDGRQTTVVREASVYSVNGFSSFGDEQLPSFWMTDNTELFDNFSDASYYTLASRPGYLLLHVEEESSEPLTYTAYQYPWIHRSMTSTNDWVLQTKLQLETLQFGDFHTGLMVETEENGSGVRYAFGIKDGTLLQVTQVTAGNVISVLASVPISTDRQTVRMRRVGNELQWDVLVGSGEWSNVHSKNVQPGSTTVQGGVFTATDTPESLRTGFDYIMLIETEVLPSIYDGLYVSEVMFDPPGGSDFEYIELGNLGPDPIDLTGLKFVDTSPFDELTLSGGMLAVGQRVLVVNDAAAMTGRYGAGISAYIVGEWAGGKLSNSGELITLVDSNDVVVISFEYDTGGRWPARSEGEAGSSLELIDPLGDLEDAGNWRASSEYLGSPASMGSGQIGDVIINELLTHTDLPAVDTIELYNTTASPISIGGWFLSDSSGNYRKYEIPTPTTIAGYSYLTFDEMDFNPNGEWNPTPGVVGTNEFAFSSKGDEVYLVEANGAGDLVRFADAREFEAAANGVSFRHYENSIGQLFMTPQVEVTLGVTNMAPLVGPVVITEVMYHPETFKAEFIELQNISSNTVPLFHPVNTTNTWKISGVGFSFPENIQLAPSEIILVASADPASVRADYAMPPGIRIFGPTSGLLQDNGETISLKRPDNPDFGEVDPPYITVDQVRYESTVPWPTTANGLGFSLERLDPTRFATDPANWRATSANGGTPGLSTLPVTVPQIRLNGFAINVEVNEFSNPANVVLEVSNSGADSLNYTLSVDQPWVQVTPVAGSSSGTNDVQVHNMIFTTAALTGGIYTGSLTVTDPGAINSPFQIPITVSVNEPKIGSTPVELSLKVQEGLNHADVDFDIFNEDERSTILNYSLVENSSWMQVTPGSGMSADPGDTVEHTIDFTTAGLSRGDYSGVMVVSDPSAPNSPYEIPVNLEVANLTVIATGIVERTFGKAEIGAIITNTFDTSALVHFYWSTEDHGTVAANWPNTMVATNTPNEQSFSGLADGLTYGVLYYGRFFGSSALGEDWSDPITFVSGTPNIPGERGLNVNVYDTEFGEGLLNPISNLIAKPVTAVTEFVGDALNYPSESAILSAFPAITQGTTYSLLFHGYLLIEEGEEGDYTFGTRSDDGTMVYVDLNLDGDFADAGELILDNNGNHAGQNRVGSVNFAAAGCYPVVIPFYENGGGDILIARFEKGIEAVYDNIDLLDASPDSIQPFYKTCPISAVELTTTGSSGVGFNEATVLGALNATASVFNVTAYYGASDGGTNAAAWNHSVSLGAYTNLASVSLAKLLPRLDDNATYYFTFLASNAAENLWSDATLMFTTGPAPHEVEVMEIGFGSMITLTSSGNTGWVPVVQYTTDELPSGEVNWLPCPIVTNDLLNGVNTTVIDYPVPNWQRFYLRILNVETP